jgi:hypothetical protein
MSANANMSDQDVAQHAAIKLLPDTIEPGRMPSGLSLTLEVSSLYERAAQYLEGLLKVSCE